MEKRWHAPKEGGFMVFVTESFNIVVPQSDIKPHDLKSSKCKCGPRSEISEEGSVLHIIHNSFEEDEALEKHLNSLGIGF
jgi:hypothetical protein